MAHVILRALETTLGGFAPIRFGLVTATYWAGRAPRVEVAGEQVRFPAPIRVAIVDGVPAADVELVPTRGVACVRWLLEDAESRRVFERYTEIPDVAEVAFGALVQVDPTTFEPTSDVVAGWEATVAEAREAVAKAKEAVVTAGTSASAATSAASEAESARSSAETASASASGSADAATQASADAASAAQVARAAGESAAAAASSLTGMRDELETGRLSEAVLRARETLNVLDYGVKTGTAASQTVAIKAALDAHPGATFRFPPGSYRLDESLVVSKGNSLVLDADARLYAGAPMGTLIDFAPDLPGGAYAEDKCLVGGTLDGALKADTILSIGKVIRFTLTQTTFVDGIRRGLVTRTGPGAELMAYNLRFHNTTDQNVADNVAIEALMGDSHYRDIITRDWTIGVIDKAANRWSHVHPWIGPDITGAAQMAKRYPASVGFDITGSSDLIACLSDTFRTAFRISSNGTSYTAASRWLGCRATWSSDTLPLAVANANPAVVVDNTAGVGAIMDRLTVTGHNKAPASFLTGTSAGLTARGTYSYGYVKNHAGTVAGNLDYLAGIVQGTTIFTPTLYGSGGAGTHTYGARTGRMVVDGDTTTYLVSIAATLDSANTFAGELRIGGLPIPQGATSVRSGSGSVGQSVGVVTSGAVIYGSPTPFVTLLTMGPTGTTGVDIPSQGLRGKAVDLILTVTVTHLRSG